MQHETVVSRVQVTSANHDEPVQLVKHGGDIPRCLMHVGQIGMAVAATAGGANGDKDGIGPADGFVRFRIEGQAPGANVALNQTVEAGLEYRHAALA